VVRFEPMALGGTGAAWPHRFALGDVDLGTSGVHSWTFTLVQDAARGDETVLFGVCSDRNLLSAMGGSSSSAFGSSNSLLGGGGELGRSQSFSQMSASQAPVGVAQSGATTPATMMANAAMSSESSAGVNRLNNPSSSSMMMSGAGEDVEDLDLLAPHPRFKLLRAFDGSAIGAHGPSPMLCVRVGDSLRCELDLTRGTLSMAVNDRPMVCVFSDVVGPVWPCVATYSERGTVMVSLTNVKCTPAHPRRKCAVECKDLTDEQVEAIAQETFQALCAEGEDPTAGETEDRAPLTFVGVPTVPEDATSLGEHGERKAMNGIGGDGDGDVANDDGAEDGAESAGEEDEELRRFDAVQNDQTSKADSSAAALLLNKAPVLYRVEESVAAAGMSNRPSSLVRQPPSSSPRPLASATQTSSIFLEPSSSYPLNSGAASSTTAARPLSTAARYEALLWELLARLSRRAFDLAVAHWRASRSATDVPPFAQADLNEAVSALYRVSGSKESSSTELLRSVDAKSLLDFAARKLVSLGEEVSRVKHDLKRPRRKPDAIS